MRISARLLLSLLFIGLSSQYIAAQSQPAASCDGCMVDRMFKRSVAAPTTETVTFAADPAADYIIDVDDQGSAGANATVTLNGKVIVTPAAVGGSARFHLRQAIRLGASNSLEVRLTGLPGSTLNVTVLGGARLVDQAGGTIRAPDGTTVTIPADALNAPTEIHAIRLSNYLPPASMGLEPACVAWRLEPDGLEFAVPVTMRIETGGLGSPPSGFLPTDLSLLHIPSHGLSAEMISPTFVDEGRVAEFTIRHFSIIFPWFGGHTDPAGRWKTSGIKWGVSTIEWYLEPPSIESFLTPTAVSDALAQWEANSGLRFHQSSTKESANLVFVEKGLIDLWHPTCLPAFTDNYGQTCFPSLAAYFGSPTLGANDQVTIYMASTDGFKDDFLSSLLHEIGHAVGIHHSPSEFWLGLADPDANVPVMNTGSSYPTSLRPADIDAAQYLYGPTVETEVPVTFVGRGTVYYVQDAYNDLPSVFARPYVAGTEFTVEYTFNALAPNLSSGPQRGVYDAVTSLTVTIGENTPIQFIKNPASSALGRIVLMLGVFGDDSYNLQLFDPIGSQFTYDLNMFGLSGQVFTSNALPTTPPDLNIFFERSQRLMICKQIGVPCAVISGGITSLVRK